MQLIPYSGLCNVCKSHLSLHLWSVSPFEEQILKTHTLYIGWESPDWHITEFCLLKEQQQHVLWPRPTCVCWPQATSDCEEKMSTWQKYVCPLLYRLNSCCMCRTMLWIGNIMQSLYSRYNICKASLYLYMYTIEERCHWSFFHFCSSI